MTQLNQRDKLKLESYLNELSSYLGNLPVSEKSEIILEIKGHVLDSYETNPDIEEILKTFGDPKEAAKKYLEERGSSIKREGFQETFKINKKPNKLLKWFGLAFLGFSLLFLVLGSIAIFKFTPIIRLDGKKGSVQILGGLIDINGGGKDDFVTEMSKVKHSFKKDVALVKKEKKIIEGEEKGEDQDQIVRKYNIEDYKKLSKISLLIGNGDIRIRTIENKKSSQAILKITPNQALNDKKCQIIIHDDLKTKTFEVKEKSHNNSSCGYDIELIIPSSFAGQEVELNSLAGTGDFSLEGVKDQHFNLTLKNGNGDVLIKNSDFKNLELRSGTGDAQLDNVYSLYNLLKMGNGDVAISFSKEIPASLKGEIRIEQGHGDAYIKLKKGSIVRVSHSAGYGILQNSLKSSSQEAPQFHISQKVGAGDMSIEEI